MAKRISRKRTNKPGRKPVKAPSAARGRSAMIRPSSNAAERRSADRVSSTPAAPAPLDFDTLTREQIRDIKAEALRAAPASAAVVAKRPGMVGMAPVLALDSDTQRVVVAEGDSWFDYPPETDLFDCLVRNHGYKMERLAERGDTLENMVFGTEMRGRSGRKIPQIEAVLRTIETLRPRVVLFSGGGNDVAGDEFAQFVNHGDSGLTLLRDDYADYMMHTVFRRCIEGFIGRVAEVARRIGRTIHIFQHGYGRAIPSGQGTEIILITWAGPWLRPTLIRKNIEPDITGRSLVTELLDRYNTMLADVAAKHEKNTDAPYHHVDFRSVIKDSDWNDELHLKSGAYARCAAVLNEVVERTVPNW